ncbi:MAG TPA: pyrimidine-nucleoside phosphorylase [Clostridiales bacterium]|nr:MAG: pyrimidine-nucleoside phosphorylase [Clostridiales bacterium GWD2_32_59]HAN09753.1 pyrimidine-nucleoside phosphorylase [Clostridiales bacterium]
MRMYDIIQKKRDGYELSDDEIKYVVDGYTKGNIPDYQMSAFLMAIYFMKMNSSETTCLTMAMASSGDILDLSCIEGVKVDKHSSGGVGDKTTLIVAPLVAACGLPVAKMSGRGLGHTGGTIDKLESIPGFNVKLDFDKFIENVNKYKIALVSQTANMTPADKKIYALRDVTATIDNISLIASSIMGKKIAAGADAIVLDVKVGSGAFMKNLDDAICLANEMVQIGTRLGRNTIAVLSDMDQPLGVSVGNTLEVIEAIETLKGKGPKDLESLCIELAAYMVFAAKMKSTVADARNLVVQKLENGEGLQKLKELVSAQGGDVSFVENPEKFEIANIKKEVRLDNIGYVHKMDTEAIGKAAMILGAGRETKDSIIDLSVGLMIHKKTGNLILRDELVVTIYGNDDEKIKKAEEIIKNAYTIGNVEKYKEKLIKAIVTKTEVLRY